jgi:hypothetical protein
MNIAQSFYLKKTNTKKQFKKGIFEKRFLFFA